MKCIPHTQAAVEQSPLSYKMLLTNVEQMFYNDYKQMFLFWRCKLVDIEVIKSSINYILNNIPEKEVIRVFTILKTLYKMD